MMLRSIASRFCGTSAAAAATTRLRRKQNVASFATAATTADLSGRVFLVTGSTDGIGQHTAERLAAAGATVLVHGRSPARVNAAAERVRAAAATASGKSTPVQDRVRTYTADLASLAGVRELAAAVAADFPPGSIDTLISNAGVYEERRAVSADGHELTWQVNVLAPFLLTALLLDRVSSHVITTSSISAASSLDWGNLQQERGYSAHSAYSLSKLMNQVFTLKLASMLAAANSPIRANTLDPGTVNTKMLLAGWGRIGIDVSTADNTYALATAPASAAGSGNYFISARQARPVAAAADPEVQERLWALWEEQTGQRFRIE
jgi:NAD(P)-dependent dehydrogenase (short-subunit alcohol dehydrogenase family)